MRKRILVVLALSTVIVIAAVAYLDYKRDKEDCRRRGEVADARLDRIKKSAEQRLPPGAPKEAAVAFFRENEIPLNDAEDEMSGILNVTGCSEVWTCNDSIQIDVRVKLDSHGRVEWHEGDSHYDACL